VTLLGATTTGTVKRHRKTGVADRSAATQVMASNVPAAIQPVRHDDPTLFDDRAPAGARYYLFLPWLDVPSVINDGDTYTDDRSRVFTIYRIEEHDGPIRHLKAAAVIPRPLTRVAA